MNAKKVKSRNGFLRVTPIAFLSTVLVIVLTMGSLAVAARQQAELEQEQAKLAQADAIAHAQEHKKESGDNTAREIQAENRNSNNDTVPNPLDPEAQTINSPVKIVRDSKTGSLTITSDDLEALEVVENLLVEVVKLSLIHI